MVFAMLSEEGGKARRGDVERGETGGEAVGKTFFGVKEGGAGSGDDGGDGDDGGEGVAFVALLSGTV